MRKDIIDCWLGMMRKDIIDCWLACDGPLACPACGGDPSYVVIEDPIYWEETRVFRKVYGRCHHAGCEVGFRLFYRKNMPGTHALVPWEIRIYDDGVEHVIKKRSSRSAKHRGT